MGALSIALLKCTYSSNTMAVYSSGDCITGVRKPGLLGRISKQLRVGLSLPLSHNNYTSSLKAHITLSEPFIGFSGSNFSFKGSLYLFGSLLIPLAILYLPTGVILFKSIFPIHIIF